MSDKSQPEREGEADPAEGKRVRIKHVFPEGTGSTFANHLIVQHTPEGEFHVTFFEIAHPLILGEEEDVRHQVEELDEITAPCVAKLVISAERMPKFIAALASNYENYEESRNSKKQPRESKKGKKHVG